MEEKQDLGEQMMEAQKQFAEQFDPQSETYHKGSQAPGKKAANLLIVQKVPIGGKNIPQGMDSEYDPNYEEKKKNLDQQENSPEYQKLSAIREQFIQLKNYLNKFCIPYEAILRHTETFKLKGNPNNQKHVDTLNKNIAIEKKKIQEIIEKLLEYQNYVSELKNTEYENIEVKLKEVMKNVDSQQFENKEQFAEYQFAVKKVSQLVFAEANKLLQEMKKVKGIEIKKN